MRTLYLCISYNCSNKCTRLIPPFDKGPFIPEKHNTYLRNMKIIRENKERRIRIRQEIHAILDGITNPNDILKERRLKWKKRTIAHDSAATVHEAWAEAPPPVAAAAAALGEATRMDSPNDENEDRNEIFDAQTWKLINAVVIASAWAFFVLVFVYIVDIVRRLEFAHQDSLHQLLQHVI